jgi:hypothetical protein
MYVAELVQMEIIMLFVHALQQKVSLYVKWFH